MVGGAPPTPPVPTEPPECLGVDAAARDGNAVIADDEDKVLVSPVSGLFGIALQSFPVMLECSVQCFRQRNAL